MIGFDPCPCILWRRSCQLLWMPLTHFILHTSILKTVRLFIPENQAWLLRHSGRTLLCTALSAGLPDQNVEEYSAPQQGDSTC